jgi:hypothetical protein
VIDAVRTVLAGMIGIRRKADHERLPLNPVHVIVAGVVLAALFVLTLVTVVRIVSG